MKKFLDIRDIKPKEIYPKCKLLMADGTLPKYANNDLTHFSKRKGTIVVELNYPTMKCEPRVFLAQNKNGEHFVFVEDKEVC